MSDASPSKIDVVGRLNPLMKRVVRHVHSRGWRVSSGWRPGGTHATGGSIDICTEDYHGGGYGPVTAQRVFADLSAAFPDVSWLVNAEYDHLHIQRYKYPCIGRNTASGTLLTPMSRKPPYERTGPEHPLGEEPMNMRARGFEAGDLFENGEQYPDHPIGDVSQAISLLSDLENGDITYLEDSERGAPKKKVIKTKDLVARVAKGKASPAQQKAFRSVVASNPGKGQAMAFAAAAKAAAQNDHVCFEKASGASAVASSIRPGSLMRPSEVTSLVSKLPELRPYEPVEFPFTGAAPTLTLDVVGSLNSVVGASANTYNGVYIKLATSYLNAALGATVTITRNLGVLNAIQRSVVSTWKLEPQEDAAEFFLINAQLVSGAPRFYPFSVTGGAGPDATTNIVISNVPANYTASARFLQLGDAVIERFLALL
jgi:hypothetical protein